MDAKSFYSKRKFFAPARSIPNPESDLSSDSDESDFVLEYDLESERRRT